ncbi:GrpB family protein [Anaerobacillus alkaliphilus]|uniref:GrpB family protein n=1 Tax=Anaerobacillus alkaliphilus TaxID=1548597 RepID=A0A4Q0VXZ0_9BACI|nr:GrpB family protein [Anaerobacillus alkaliphilus]RXJ04574.1 GrpB family protein [Anaerobacillus alkaliphilus]
MLGLKKGEVKLVDYSDRWKKLFEEECDLLHSIIGKHTKDIQHFGSTAIHGIQAKPMIDILVGVESLRMVEHFDQQRLKEIGYYHLPRVQIERKVVFAKFSNLETLTKTHVMHVVEYGGSWWQEHIFFRNYLNAHQEAAIEYEALKKRLARTYPNDERSYTDEKKRFVDDILMRRAVND